MARIGEKIGGGSYQSFHREQITNVDFSTYRGKWIVLMFYPGDFTFICPTELSEVAALYPEFQKAGAEVFGISTDSVFVHKAWHDTSPRSRMCPSRWWQTRQASSPASLEPIWSRME